MRSAHNVTNLDNKGQSELDGNLDDVDQVEETGEENSQFIS